MKRTDSRSMMSVLRAWLNGSAPAENEWTAGPIPEFVIEKAMSGHFGYFKLVLDMVGGKLHRTAADEMTVETGCVIVVVKDEQETEKRKVARVYADVFAFSRATGIQQLEAMAY